MNIAVYNNQGKENGTLEASDAIFGVKTKKSVLHQVYTAVMSNARQPWADAKDRSEVRGGGKKPWKQKGTGRARHGSIRSPIWKGGGVTFGPLSIRNYKRKVNRKTNRLAVRMALSAKVQDGTMIVLEDTSSIKKAKDVAALRKVLPGVGKTTLLLVAESDDTLNLATRNIERLDMQRAADVNVVDLMHHQYVIATKDALQVLEQRFETK